MSVEARLIQLSFKSRKGREEVALDTSAVIQRFTAISVPIIHPLTARRVLSSPHELSYQKRQRRLGQFSTQFLSLSGQLNTVSAMTKDIYFALATD